MNKTDSSKSGRSWSRRLADPSSGSDRLFHPFLGSPLALALGVTLVGLVSGFLLKAQQLHAVAPELAAVYPFAARMPFVLLRVLGVALFFVLDAAILGAVLRLPFERAAARLGETFGLVALGYLFGPLARFWLVPVLVLLVNARALMAQADRGEARDWFARHASVLACVAAIGVAYAVYFAPLLDPLIAIDQIDRFKAIIPFSLANTMRSTLPAVAGLQEPAWHPQLTLGGGSLRPEIMGHQNYLLAALFSLFPVSAADVVAVFELEKLAVFLLYCMGGVGYFLFCRFGLRTRRGTAFVVGLVSVMSDGILARHPEVDWGYASCAVPFVLLAVKRAADSRCLWLFAVAGGLAGIAQSLHFTHPEVILAGMYFVMGWLLWDFALTLKHDEPWRARARRLAGIPIFAVSCVLANVRFVGGLLEFAIDGNQITSERLHDYAASGHDVVALQLLAPLGLRGSGPFPEPYVPYFFGITVAFLAVLAVVRLARRPAGAPPLNTWLSFAVVAPLLLGVVSLFGSSIVGALYGLGVPGFPFHTGLRILHPVHACLMVLFAFGLDELRAVGDGLEGNVGRSVVLKTLAVFVAVVLLLGPRVPDTSLHHVEVLFAVVAVVIGCFVPMWSQLRLVVVGGLVVASALFATRDLTMVNGAGYHKNVLARARLDPKVASDTLASRLLHPEVFAPSVYPLSMRALLQPMREDLANPRTQRYVWTFVQTFRRDLLRVVALRARAGGEDAVPSTADAHATIVTLDRWLADVGGPSGVDTGRLGELLALETPHDHLYYHDQTGGLKEVDRIMASLPPEVRYARVAYSNDFKIKAGGDALNDFPTFENSHYYVMGSANLRWPSALDYFFPDIKRIMTEPLYYDANLFPPVSRDALDLLGFNYIMVTPAELPAFTADTEIVAKTGTGTLLHNKAALPRATLFRRARFIPPLVYNDMNFNSMARVERGRTALAATDLKNELLIEDGAPPPLPKDAGPRSPGLPGEGVDVVRISGNFAVFKVRNPGAEALLFYSDAYHPDWRAYVDRDRRSVLRADLGFKAVPVPTGEHLVWMEFVPWRAELAHAAVLLLAIGVVTNAARAFDRRRGVAVAGVVS